MSNKSKFIIISSIIAISILSSSFANSFGFALNFLLTMPIVGILFFNIYKENSYKNSYKIFVLVLLLSLTALMVNHLITDIGQLEIAGILSASIMSTIIMFILFIIGVLVGHLFYIIKKKETTSVKKIVVAVLIVLLLIPILFFLNAFLGNPISKAISNINADKYIEKNYSHLDIHRDKTFYNFKMSIYTVKYTSDKLMDLNFDVNCDVYGKVIDDTYEYDIKNKESTLNRITKELRSKSIEETINGKETIVSFYIELEDKFPIAEKLEAEMSLKSAIKELPVYMNIEYITDKENVEEMRDIVLKLHEKYKDEYIIKYINLDVYPDNGKSKGSLIYGINPKILYEKNSVEQLKKLYEENKLGK